MHHLLPPWFRSFPNTHIAPAQIVYTEGALSMRLFSSLGTSSLGLEIAH